MTFRALMQILNQFRTARSLISRYKPLDVVSAQRAQMDNVNLPVAPQLWQKVIQRLAAVCFLTAIRGDKQDRDVNGLAGQVIQHFQ